MENENWNKAQIRLAPLSYCSYITNYSTKIDYDEEDGVEVYYYPYSGNNLPFFACVLEHKTKQYLSPTDNEIDTGFFFGLFNNVCGYFVVLHNSDKQFGANITIHRDISEGSVALMMNGLSSLFVASMALYMNF